VVGKDVSFGARAPEFKEFAEAKAIKLPVPIAPGLTVEEAVHRRESVRRYVDRSVSMEQLSRLLIAANGVTHIDSRMVHRSFRRPEV